ncbi:AarF/UbiB family protein [Chitinimonas sp. PSY-7]|uniref:AarF/UbiB family protein n=1 Tax=Chitinimonas sp. PSY-7 TaxID=3459088 RepID=UPI00403FF2A8
MSIDTLQRAISANENMAINARNYERSTAGIVLEVIVGLLTGGIGVIGFEVYHSFNKSHKNQEFSELTGGMLKGMREMPPEEEGFTFQYQGSPVQIRQEGNDVKILFGNEERTIHGKTIGELRENIKKEILNNIEKCTVETAVMALKDETANQRSLALQVLQAKTNLTQFDHVATVDLVQAAIELVSGAKNSAEITHQFDKSDITGRMFLDAESKELLEKWEAADKGRVVAVNAIHVQQIDDNRPVQSEDEKKVRKLFAEAFFPEKSWEADTLEPGERLKNVFIENSDVLAEIYAKPELIDAAGIPEGLSTVAKETLTSLKEQTNLVGIRANQENIKSILENTPAAYFTRLSESIDEKFGDFKFSSLDGVQMLSNIGDVGEGNLQLFVKNVLGKYFDNQTVIDKRAMIASFLNDARAGDTDERKLVGLLKGGGPYLQKMLQLLGDNAPPELKKALDEMKASLSPINDQIIKSNLNGIVDRSGGKIAKIELGKNLGAASVGQTVLANIYWKSKGDEPQEVVVKLLRPGIRLRADRELVFMRQEADAIAGMRKTFDGISEQVQVEMDLSKEAHNVRLAQVYNTGHANLTAMKLVDEVPPSQGYMVLEKAKGTTVNSAFTALEDKLKKPMDANNKAPEIGTKLASGIKALTTKWVEEGLFGTGFYHGDLHSGNIMFSDDNGLLTVIDMGNATTLSVEQRTAVFKMVMAAGVHSPEVFVRNFEKVLSEEGKLRIADKRTALLEQTRQIMNSTEDPGKVIFSILDAANKLGLEIPATVSNFSRSQIMLQSAIDNINSLNNQISQKLTREVGAYAGVYFRDVKDLSIDKLPALIQKKLAELESSEENVDVVNAQKNQLEMLSQHSNTLLSRGLAPINFSQIIENIGLNHKMDSLNLARGDIMGLWAAQNAWVARQGQLDPRVNAQLA